MTAGSNQLFSRRGQRSGRLEELIEAKASQRDGQATRRRIVDAAFAAFAAAGLAGARVDRIATAAALLGAEPPAGHKRGARYERDGDEQVSSVQIPLLLRGELPPGQRL